MEEVSNPFAFEPSWRVVRDVLRSKITNVGVSMGAKFFVEFLVSSFSDLFYVIYSQVRVKGFVTYIPGGFCNSAKADGLE